MFDKILIANRGEIACRVIATAQRLGIKTVAVYSDADALARHVGMADEAVPIGPAEAAASYLNIEKILAVCKETGAQAVHPGYGFLSENAEFVAALTRENVKFIGPSAKAIKAMGLKDAAKNLMIEAGVPVVPGYQGDTQDLGFLAEQAEKIGYPIMIKARAGGGGKGMRLVEKAADFAAALEAAQREGQASFGDPVCLIEKYVQSPRHIEIQIFGDRFGNVVHVFERDCSLQRRHQKVIEEAPAPNMPDSMRNAMGQAAVNATKAIHYEGAGTVEFIVDGSGPLNEDGFWFMEMNTRLQVEHPVSEAITGLDFVELQLRVAAGQALPFTQSDLTINGWSFEARIYAEDVAQGFLPAPGSLRHLAFPSATEFSPGLIRVDSGVVAGDDISPWYDPMIAKLIVHGQTREAALTALKNALAQTRITGLTTNIGFLHALTNHDGFAKGDVDTTLIDRDVALLSEKPQATLDVHALAALALAGLLPSDQTGDDPWDRRNGWQHWSKSTFDIALLDEDGDEITVRLRMQDSRTVTALHKDQELTLHLDRLNLPVIVEGDSATIFRHGQAYLFQKQDPLESVGDQDRHTDTILSPMSGTVTVLDAEEGAKVAKGDRLLVLEAMKMEHALTSPRDGVIMQVSARVGEQVDTGITLIALEPEENG